MRTALLLLLLATTAGAQVAPQRQDPGNRFRSPVYGLGLSAGLASGFGLSFRHHLPSTFSYQIVGGIIKSDAMLHYSIGTELQFDLVVDPRSRFFACGALGYFYSGSKGANELDAPMRIGAGFGGEWSDFAPFHLGAELLFTYFSDGVVLPLPQVSGHYYFF